MCIIAIKESGIDFPSIDTMRACFTNNPDGAGFMYPRNHKVIIDKGYMTWDKFEKRYNELLKTFSKKTPFVFHFRIGTHGEKNAGMTHPFPLGQEKPDYTKTKNEADCAFVHNGIFSFLPTHKKYSDTVIYGKKILEPLYTDHPNTFIDNSAEAIILATIGYSKLAFMRTDGGIEYFGQWITENGIHYSNDTYKERKFENWISDYLFDDDKPSSDSLVSWFYNTEKTYASKLVYIRPGDVWKVENLEFDGFSFSDDPFPSIARIGNMVFEYDDANDIWDFVGYKHK